MTKMSPSSGADAAHAGAVGASAVDTRVDSSKVPIAVFASGEGSNLQAILDAGQNDCNWPGEVRLVVSDRPNCKAVARARMYGIDVFAGRPASYSDKAAFETDVLKQLLSHDVEWIVLAGYMRLIGVTLLEAYRDRIVNIHPSLLPQFPGKQAVKDALEAGVCETGVTIHFVDDGIDTGPIIAQRKVAIQEGMDEEMLLNRVHDAEHSLYPEVLARLLK